MNRSLPSRKANSSKIRGDRRLCWFPPFLDVIIASGALILAGSLRILRANNKVARDCVTDKVIRKQVKSVKKTCKSAAFISKTALNPVNITASKFEEVVFFYVKRGIHW